MNGASRSVPLDPSRRRRPPRTGFGWIDRRFFREGFAAELSPDAMLLYAFLCTVADSRGHSWYGDPRVGQLLRMPPARIQVARDQLRHADLVRYERPTYQVLSLPSAPIPLPAPRQRRPDDNPPSIGSLIRRHL